MKLNYYLQLGKAFRKSFYYIGSWVNYCLPNVLFRLRLKAILRHLTDEERKTVNERADYYNRMQPCTVSTNWKSLRAFRYFKRGKKKFSTYFFDLYKYTRYFNQNYRFLYLFGDVTEEMKEPTIVKSRPITKGTTNSVLMNLNQIRHFNFINDKLGFKSKKNMLVSRNIVAIPKRIRLLEMYFNHPLCNFGQINTDIHPEWVKDYMTIDEQLTYKFIMCIEGNDVATNLKWVMSSNSVAVMPRPAYETWFMEGTLIPDYHYIAIKEDYSDLIEKANYYIEHPEEAEAIIRHAHEYIRRFGNEKIERAVSLTVLDNYFRLSGQL